MNIALLITIMEAAPTVVGDIEAAIAKVKGDANLAAKLTDGVAALEGLVTDLKTVISKL